MFIFIQNLPLVNICFNSVDKFDLLIHGRS